MTGSVPARGTIPADGTVDCDRRACAASAAAGRAGLGTEAPRRTRRRTEARSRAVTSTVSAVPGGGTQPVGPFCGLQRDGRPRGEIGIVPHHARDDPMRGNRPDGKAEGRWRSSKRLAATPDDLG